MFLGPPDPGGLVQPPGLGPPHIRLVTQGEGKASSPEKPPYILGWGGRDWSGLQPQRPTFYLQRGHRCRKGSNDSVSP